MNTIGTILFVAGLLFSAYLFLRSRPWLSRAEYRRNNEWHNAEAEQYIRVTVMYAGKPVNLLMTYRELAIAKARAERQPEEFEP